MATYHEKHITLSVLIALVVGGIIGWAVGSYVTPEESVTNSDGFVAGIGGGPQVAQNIGPYFTTTADFRVHLNSLFKGHGILASEYLKNLYDGKDATVVKSQLLQNTNDIADIVGKMYGSQAKQKFVDMWNTHILEYEKFTKALKDNNSRNMDKAKENLALESTKMGQTLSQMDEGFSTQTITNLLNEHIRLTLDTIDAYAKSDTQRIANDTKASLDQAGEMADYIGQVIAASHPDKL